MKKLLVLGLLIVPFALLFSDIAPEKEKVAIIWGKKHVFSVLTPTNWILDRELANQNRLASFFYPEENTNNPFSVFIYAQGYDKPNTNSTVEEFINDDIKNVKKSNPKLEIKKKELVAKGSVIKSLLYEYNNLEKKYKEERVYIETTDNVILIVYSIKNKNDYKKYLKNFDYLINSFEYLGNDPDTFFNNVNSNKDIKKDFKEVIKTKSDFILKGHNKDSSALAFDPLFQVNLKNNGEYSIVKMPASDMLIMISMLGSDYNVDSIIAFNDIDSKLKKELSNIFTKFIDKNDIVSIVKKGDKKGYLIFSRKDEDWLLKILYLPGGIMY